MTRPLRAVRENPEGTPDREIVQRTARTHRIKGARWCYDGRIPTGALSLLAGREGIGKSTVAIDILAQLTRGELPGRYLGKPSHGVLATTEDSWEHTVMPRLVAAKADLDLIHRVAIRTEQGAIQPFTSDVDDVKLLEEALSYQPRLMILDPVMSILSGRVDTYKQSEVQRALNPLLEMCERIEMAVLGLIHVNKMQGVDPLSTIMASRAFATVPRSVMFCIEADQGEYLFTHEKCTIGPKYGSRQYLIEGVPVAISPEELEEGEKPWVSTGRISWGDSDDRSAEDVLRMQEERSKLGDVATSIVEFIDSQHGVVSVAQIQEELDIPRGKADNNLSRLVKSGKIVRAGLGRYQSVKITPKGP